MKTMTYCPTDLHIAMQPGEVALVGAGPGDPALLTLRAWDLLQQANAIVYDRLISPELLALIPESCVRYYTGKSAGHHSLPQDEINELLVRLAQENLKVVRLKGGDPFVFGRGAEEVEYLLHHDITCQVVPGITAASACTAYAGIPLTHRDLAQSCRFITGHLRENGSLDLNWSSLTCPNETLVFYMGLSNLNEITTKLITAGLSATTPAALISNGASTQQKIARGTLVQLPALALAEQFRSPTLIVVGRVVSLFSNEDIRYPASFANVHKPERPEHIVCA